MRVNVKYLDDQSIRLAADQFRSSRDLQGVNTPPIDVIYIAEVVLKLDVIPLPNLIRDQRLDAALLPDLSGFYIDEDAYMSWEKGQRWVEKRLRFSFAHELGHYVLHRDEISANRLQSLDQFRQWAAALSAYGSAEYQANEFAGRFLVPLDLLQLEYDVQCRKLAATGAAWREIEGMREYVAKQIAPRFGVNHQVIEVRLDREGIWPAE